MPDIFAGRILLQAKQNVLPLLAALLAASASIPMTQILPQKAYATPCADLTHCYAEETNNLTTYGNSFTTIVSDLTLSNYCNYFITVEQWIGLPNGDWLENGFTTGTFNGSCVTNEMSFHAKQISGAYSETNDGAVSVGSTKWYELSDSNKDKVWDVKIDGSNVATMTIPYTSGINQNVGSETTDDSAGVPKTHLYDIAWLKSTLVWEYWGAANTFGAENPLWILNCTPNYRHIHVGSGTVGNCT